MGFYEKNVTNFRQILPHCTAHTHLLHATKLNNLPLTGTTFYSYFNLLTISLPTFHLLLQPCIPTSSICYKPSREQKCPNGSVYSKLLVF